MERPISGSDLRLVDDDFYLFIYHGLPVVVVITLKHL